MKPTIGRIVHYRPSAEEREVWRVPESAAELFPAIITRVWSEWSVNLRVFLDDSDRCPVVTSATEIEGEPEGNGWVWPKRTPLSAEEVAKAHEVLHPNGVIVPDEDVGIDEASEDAVSDEHTEPTE